MAEASHSSQTYKIITICQGSFSSPQPVAVVMQQRASSQTLTIASALLLKQAGGMRTAAPRNARLCSAYFWAFEAKWERLGSTSCG